MNQDRGARGRGYTLITPANHYPSRLPEFGPDQPVVKLVTPRLKPSRIGEHLVTLTPQGGTTRPVEDLFETFFHVLDGDVTLSSEGDEHALPAGGHAYLPAEATWELTTEDGAQLVLLKRRYETAPGLAPPHARFGHREDAPWEATAVPGFTRRELLPVTDPAWDMAMSLLRFEPGVDLGKVEVHDEEHGLLMTQGGGTYELDREPHEVQAGDFIHMAPYCPQAFTAGPDGAEYLLYKDAWRDGT